MNPIIVQALGYLGVLGFVLSFMQNNRKAIIAFSLGAKIMFILHYGFLGAASGSIQHIFGVIACIISYLRGKKPFDSKLAPIIIIVLSLIGGVFSYDSAKGLICLCPVIAMLMQNIALWMKNQTFIRLIMLASIPLWFAYNITNFTIPAMVSDALSTISLVYSITRFDIIPAIKNRKTDFSE